MNERIDHVAQALRDRDYAESPGPGDPTLATNWLLSAQVHATLALVEQQRIANLIALATGVDVISGHGIARMASNEAHRHLVSDPNGEFLPKIREALGMS